MTDPNRKRGRELTVEGRPIAERRMPIAADGRSPEADRRKPILFKRYNFGIRLEATQNPRLGPWPAGGDVGSPHPGAALT
jgi:hypothetical protein